MDYNKISRVMSSDDQLITSEESFLTTLTPDVIVEPISATVVNCQRLNVRIKPTKNSDSICVLYQGDSVVIEKIHAEWTYVYTASGIDGFVMSEYIKEDYRD